VAGKNSSNGRVLYNICKRQNPQSYFISSPDELAIDWFNEGENIGICGATSTPQWLLEQVKAHIEKF
jgi:4-hydroxy-3-methylbut-2-enyl diphosphate reductase